MIQVDAINIIPRPGQNEYSLRYLGASTVRHASSGVHTVLDWLNKLISTNVKHLSSGLSRDGLFIHPWKTLESALDQYIVANSGPSALSGTVQAVRTARPTALITEYLIVPTRADVPIRCKSGEERVSKTEGRSCNTQLIGLCHAVLLGAMLSIQSKKLAVFLGISSFQKSTLVVTTAQKRNPRSVLLM